jgi:prepilin-type N-terminal cleavage/methylation domain-containing protein
MKSNKKKGFTIVELVIVIAVIAILAAVLIPTFVKLIRKSKINKDTQLIRNLNTALSVDRVENPHNTMTDALAAAAASGYDVGKINATATNNEILWDSVNDVFCYLNDGSIEYLPDSVDNKLSADSYKLWKIYNKTPDSGDKFSIYVGSDEVATYVSENEVSVGVDCGVANVKKITYRNTGDAKDDVIIRTNAFSTQLIVDGNVGDEISHYGYAGIVEVVKVALSSYKEFGVVGRLTVQNGHVDVQEGATVYQMLASSGDSSLVSVASAAVVFDREGVQFEGNLNKSAVDFVLDAAADCAHERTDYVIDGIHVYEVCKDCGYTVITIIDGTESSKMTRVDDDGIKMIVPKSTYTIDGDKVSVDGYDARISEDAEATEPTPSIDGTGTLDCKHAVWNYVNNGDGTHTATCSVCHITFTDNHNFNSDDTCVNCGYYNWVRKYWRNIALRMGATLDGYSVSGDTITISSNIGLAQFAIKVNEDHENFAGKTVELAQDIDLLNYYWTPISGFNGTFDGKGYTISNLYVYDGNQDGSGYGLFGRSNPTAINNVNISNVYIGANSAIGAILGDGNTTIDNCNVTGDILLEITTTNTFASNYNSSYIGGIIGHGSSVVTNSRVIGNDGSRIAGGRQVGGIYGFSSEGNRTICNNCTVNNLTLSGGICIGGIVGWAHFANDITNNTVSHVTLIGSDSFIWNDNKTKIGFITGTTNVSPNDNPMICDNNVCDNSSLYLDTTKLTDEVSCYSLYASYGLNECYLTDDNGKYVFFNTVNNAVAYAKANDTKTLVLLMNAAYDGEEPIDEITIDKNGHSFVTDGYAISLTNNDKTTYYATIGDLENALGYIQNASLTAVLLKDVTVSSNFDVIALNFTLDLNGYTFKSTAPDVFQLGGGTVLEVIDSVGTGAINQPSGDELLYAPNGTLIISSGTITTVKAAMQYEDYGNLIVRGGTFNVNPSTYVDGTLYDVVDNGNGTYSVVEK